MDTIETINHKYADLGYVTGRRHYDIDEPPDRPQVTRKDVRKTVHSYSARCELEGNDYPINALLNYDL